MPFSFGPILPNYTSLRYPIILALEERGAVPSPGVYFDGNGYATIGAGFLVGAQARAILRGMGYQNPTAALVLAITNEVGSNGHRVFATDAAAQSALNTALRRATGNPNDQFPQFRFDFDPAGNPVDPAPRIEQVFDAIAQGYEDLVNDWLPPSLIIQLP
jgi:hypothetical protein